MAATIIAGQPPKSTASQERKERQHSIMQQTVREQMTELFREDFARQSAPAHGDVPRLIACGPWKGSGPVVFLFETPSGNHFRMWTPAHLGDVYRLEALTVEQARRLFDELPVAYITEPEDVPGGLFAEWDTSGWDEPEGI